MSEIPSPLSKLTIEELKAKEYALVKLIGVVEEEFTPQIKSLLKQLHDIQWEIQMERGKNFCFFPYSPLFMTSKITPWAKIC